ncbi:MAG: Gfo/Idh/MocA family oxidoreductase [Candidatus Diapherotrites archaeon]|nr:Gfo/Idh/MocA family oxidoreductase [Candidatus Diapherotrites archaeon]
MINFGLIGCGYWGPNYLRVIKENNACSLKYCCDVNPEALIPPAAKYNVKTTLDYADVLNDKKIDAVVISTPAAAHYTIVKEALFAGKDVLVEKPMTVSSKEALELVKIAEKKGRILMVGHIFKFNPGINKIKKLIETEKLGKILYANSLRTGLGPVRCDVNALWDLGSHDISIFLYLFDKKPISIIAEGCCFLQDGIEDITSMSIHFEDDVIANTYLSWVEPCKTRKLTIIGDKKAVYFDCTSADSISILNKFAVSREASKKQLTNEALLVQRFRPVEPLKEEFKHFLNCVKERSNPISNGLDGYNVVKVMEAAQRSLKNGGMRIKINS